MNIRELNKQRLTILTSGNVVMAMHPHDPHGYVTWEYDANGDCYWGHYFQAFEPSPRMQASLLMQAITDWNERTANN